MRQLILVLVALVAATALAGCGASKEFVWQRIDTDVLVQPDGGMQVTETLTLRYTGGPFTFVIRDLAERRLDAISTIRVRDGTREYRLVDDDESREPYTFSVVADDGVQRVRMVYPETTGGERTFILSYDVAGAVRRYDGHDEVWWSFAFADREELVEQATGRLRLPEAVPAAQLAASVTDWPGTVETGPGEVVVQARDIPPERELAMRVEFPTGVVGGGAPAWQARADAQDSYDATLRPTVNVILSAVAAGLFVLLSAVIWFWWRRNRDPQPQGFAARELPAPPDELAPATAARLLGRSLGEQVLGTLFDLANRGFLAVREQPRGRDLLVTRTAVPAEGLSAFEQATLETLGLRTPGSEVALAEQHTALSKATQRLDQLQRSDLVARGLLDEGRLARRRSGYVASAILLVVSLAAFIPAAILAQRISVWLPIIALVGLVMGFAWLIVASSVRGTTPEGAQALVRWQAFGRYLSHLRGGGTPAGQFPALLPYAAATGHATGLTKAYATTAEPLPAWYYPLLISNASPSGGGGAAGTGGTMLLHDFSQSFISALTSAGSSVGGAGGAGGAAGGASGGGGGSAG